MLFNIKKMENFYNRINEDKAKDVYHPIYLKRHFDKRSNPILIKEKFFNLKIFHDRNKYNNDSPNIMNKRYLRNSLDVKDINCRNNHLFKRETNPLEPKYKYDWQMTEVNEDRKVNYINYNTIENHPKALYPYKIENNFNLNTLDIPGSQSGTKSPLSKIELKYGRKLHITKDDIDGSHPDTLIRGIKTRRNTNPLEPDYPLLKGKLYEYEKEAKKIKERYDYKSLLDYYNKHSKINSINNDGGNYNKMKIKNEISVDINKLSRNKNLMDGFGKDKKVYKTDNYKSSRNNLILYDNNIENYNIDY